MPQLAANWPPALGSCSCASCCLSFLRLASSCSSKQHCGRLALRQTEA